MAASLTVRTNGQTVITALYRQDGSTAVSVFSDQNLSSSTTVGPISSDTTYWVATDDHYVLSVTQPDGSQIADGNGATRKIYLAAGSPLEVSPAPTQAQVLADLTNSVGISGRARIVRGTQVLAVVDTNGNTNSTITDATQRWVVTLPFTTTRWRLRLRNWNSFTGTVRSGVIAGTGVYLGTPSYSSGSWGSGAGDFTATPTQATASFSTATGGGTYQSEWVTSPALQFTGGTPRGVSLGLDFNGLTIDKGSRNSVGRYSTAGTGAASSTAGSTAMSGSQFAGTTFPGFLSIEYEGISNATVGLVLGDSIGGGITTAAALLTPTPAQGWIDLAAQVGGGGVVVNGCIGGTVSADWADATKFARFISDLDVTTTVPDYAVLNVGSNDAANSVASATFQANVLSAVTKIKALGIQQVFLATVIPRNFTAASAQEVARLAYNAWLRTNPSGCTVLDPAQPLETAGSPEVPLAYYVPIVPHPTTGGYAFMAKTATVPSLRT